MNASTLEFSLLALLLLIAGLLVLNGLSGAPSIVFASFAPMLMWAVVLAAKSRRSR